MKVHGMDMYAGHTEEKGAAYNIEESLSWKHCLDVLVRLRIAVISK
jgi:hypothetical protein